mmetsp:Transcript_27574/g.50052  ORF Transcript_27574/g.50052 Transcript_27574/m.50052 type:complete len:201 (-) Transcript_27574:75-677(-)
MASRTGVLSLGRLVVARSAEYGRASSGVVRSLSSEASSSTSTSGDYVSPYKDLLEGFQKQTTLGTDATKPYVRTEIKRLECGVPEEELRFRTVSYGRSFLPPFVEPGEHKVTLKVQLQHIPFSSPEERQVFLEIVGPRYIRERDELRLNSEQFASRIENKRHLVFQLERIVLHAKRLAAEYYPTDNSTTNDDPSNQTKQA